jgi:hypothetical protein
VVADHALHVYRCCMRRFYYRRSQSELNWMENPLYLKRGSAGQALGVWQIPTFLHPIEKEIRNIIVSSPVEKPGFDSQNGHTMHTKLAALRLHSAF